MKIKSIITAYCILMSLISFRAMSQMAISSQVLCYSKEQTKKADWDSVTYGYLREIAFTSLNQAQLGVSRIRQNIVHGKRTIDTFIPNPENPQDRSTTDYYTNFTKQKAIFNFENGTSRGELPPIWYAHLPKINKTREFSGIFLEPKGETWIDTLTQGGKVYINKFKKLESNVYELDGYATDKSKLAVTEAAIPAPGEAITVESVQKAEVYKAKISVGANNFIISMNGENSVEESMNLFGQTVDRKYKEYFYVTNKKK